MCCLVLLHILMGIGICAHLYEVLPSLHSPSLACYYLTPINYGLFLAFLYFVVISSVMSIKMVNKLSTAISFVTKLNLFYTVFIFYSIATVISVYLPETVCNTSEMPKFWPTIWSVFAFVECVLMSSYLSYFNSKLHGLEALISKELEKGIRDGEEMTEDMDSSRVNMNYSLDFESYMY